MIIITGVTAYNSNWYLKNNLDGTKNILVSSLRKAQEYALIKKNNLTWGVCLTNNIIRMYGGSCASPTIKDDYILPPNVSLTGFTTVSFSSLRGEPSLPQNIIVSSGDKTYTISLNSVGGLNIAQWNTTLSHLLK